jgi:hypothetical protein
MQSPEVKIRQNPPKKLATMIYLPPSSAEVPPRNTWGQRRQTKDTPPSPKTPPTHRLPPIVWVGSIGVRRGQRVTMEKLTIFPLLSLRRIVPAPSHQREQPQAIGTPQHIIVNVSLFCHRLVAILQGCRPQRVLILPNKLT